MKELLLLGVWSYMSGVCLFLFCVCVEGFDMFLQMCSGITWGSFMVICPVDVLLIAELRARARKEVK